MIRDFAQQLNGYIKYLFKPWIMIDGYIKFRSGQVVHNNFGDDINIPLLEALTGKKVIHISQSKLWRIPRLLCIGSIIENFISEKSIIWGSGCMFADRIIKCPPAKVYALRGKLTRRRLIEQGIPCPEVYGDPALLFPYIYTPKTNKKYTYGIIPHYIDYDLPHVKAFRDSHPEILFIRFRDYESWQNVIEQINSCENIISSSLHGLILSDAYDIPNVRVVFSNLIAGEDFKYKDYYSGINRDYPKAIDCKKEICLESIEKNIKEYKPITYDPQALLRAFPYKLCQKFIELANEKRQS